MPAGHPTASQDNGAPPADHDRPVSDDRLSVLLHQEELSVSRRKRETATIRVETVTHSFDHLVDEELVHERVEVERVPVGRYVETAPPVREEGDLTILSIVEEVVERRLLLREEVHIRRVRTTERFVETVTLRKQDAVVTRTATDTPAGPAPSTQTATNPENNP